MLKRRFLIISLVFLSGILLLLLIAYIRIRSSSSYSLSNVSSEINVSLELSKAPRLNEPADLTFTISSTQEAPGTVAVVKLPEGAVLVGGDLEWTGNLQPKQPVTLRATIMFVHEGNWTIQAGASRYVYEGEVWGDTAEIYLHLSREKSYFGFPTLPPERGSDNEAAPLPVELFP